MKKWFAALMCFGVLLLCACGENDAPGETSFATTTAEVIIATEASSTRVLQPLPEGCRLVEYKEIRGRVEAARKERDPDVEDFLENKTQTTRWTDGHRIQLVLRDNPTGEEIILTSPYEDEPYMKYVINERYIVWTTYYRANNNFHGIYDIKRDRYIEIESGGYVRGMNGGYLYAIPRIQQESLCVYRIPLKDLDKKDSLEDDVNLLEGLPEAIMRDYQQIYFSEGLSADCRYYAAHHDELGVLVFDLHVPKLVLHVPSEAIPERLYAECFTDDKTVYYYNENEPLAIEITLP